MNQATYGRSLRNTAKANVYFIDSKTKINLNKGFGKGEI